MLEELGELVGRVDFRFCGCKSRVDMGVTDMVKMGLLLIGEKCN